MSKRNLKLLFIGNSFRKYSHCDNKLNDILNLIINKRSIMYGK